MSEACLNGLNIYLPGTGGTVPRNIIGLLSGLSILNKAIVFADDPGDEELSKAVKDDGGQYRWITVHPNGADTDGVPVKIKVNPDGSGSVVAGAGGKLNMMKLTRLKSPEEYRQAARIKRQAKKRAEEALPDEAKANKREALEAIAAQETAAQAEYLKTISEAQGWESWKLPEEIRENAPEQVADRLERARLRDVLRRADQLVGNIREKVIEEHDATVAQALGEVPVEALDVAPEKDRTGLGYVAAVERVAREAGLTKPEEKVLSDETRMKAFEEAEAAGYIESAQKAEDATQGLIAGAAMAREEDRPFKEQGIHRVDVDTALKDPSAAKNILLAQQAYKARMKELEQQRRKVSGADPDTTAEIARGVTLAVGESAPKAAAKDLEAKLEADLQAAALEKSNSALLSQIEKVQGTAAAPLEHHINTGRYDGLNEIASGVFHQACPVDRLAADLLGTDAAAQLMAHALASNLSPDDLKIVKDALGDYHVETQRQVADEAVKTAAEKMKAAEDAVSGIKLSEATADDLVLAQSANNTRKRLLAEAAQSLGEAHGRLEMAGTLNFALLGKPSDEIRASLGQISSRRAFQIAETLGLDRNECEVVSDGPNKFLVIPQTSWDKLVKPISKEQSEAYDRAVTIKRGENDEEGWLPKGFRDPKSMPNFEEAEDATAFSRPLSLRSDMSPAEVHQETFDFIDRALADNPYNPRGVRDDVTNAEFVNSYVPRAAQEAYAQAVADYFPEKDLDDAGIAEMYRQRVEAAREKMLAAGEISEDDQTLHSQAIELGEPSYDAMHRALAKVPEAAVVFQPVKSAEDRRAVQAAVQDYFWNNLTKEKRDEAAAARAKVREEGKKASRTVTVTNMFGEEEEVAAVEGGAASVPKAEPDAWQRFVSSFGSGPQATQRAYEAIQDHMRGQFAEAFAKEYGKTFGVDLKMGTRQVPHWDRFVLGTAPKDVRDALMQEEASKMASASAAVATRTRGQFAPGARRELAEKILQRGRDAHQMGLFAKDGFRPISDRATLGDTIEAQLAKLMPTIGANFQPGKKTELPSKMSMDGKYVRQQRAIKLVKANKRIGMHLGVGCIAGDTVLVDPVTGNGATVRDYYERGVGPRVAALATDGSLRVAQALVPFIKGRTVLKEVVTADGQKITVAPSHLFLTPDGWKMLSDLDAGTQICAVPCATYPLASNSDTSPSANGEGGQHSGRTVPSSQGGYLPGCRSSDERPLPAQAGARVSAPSQAGVHAHSRHCWPAGGQGDTEAHSPTCPQSSRQTRPGFSLLSGPRSVSEREYRTYETNTRSSQPSTRTVRLSLPGSSPRRSTTGAVAPSRNHAAAAFLYLAECLRRSMQYEPASPCNRGVRRSLGTTSVLAKVQRRPADLASCSPSVQSERPETTPDCIPYWVSIASITDTREEEYFDFTVPVHHNYVAHGLIHHNSGKTNVGLGSFTELHKEGKVKRGIFAVPSVVAGQFGSEARKYLEPRTPDGKGYRWAVASGLSRDERLAQYKNPDTHMVFVTHQALRDDILHEVAKANHGGDEAAAAAWLRSAPEAERRPVVQKVIKDAGWGFDYSMIDEGHDLLNRKGKPNSAMANAIDDFTAGHEYHISATGTPVKNDVSEAFDVLHKLRPDLYPKEAYGEFHRRYGLNTQASAEALQRELAPHVYAEKIDSGAKRITHEHVVDLSPRQKEEYRNVLQAYRQARRAAPGSAEHIEAMKVLSPDRFKATPEDQHAALAKDLSGGKGMLRDMMLHRVEHAHHGIADEDNAMLQEALHIADGYRNSARDGGQAPGIIFAHHHASVDALVKAFKAAGYRVGKMTGKQTSTDKEMARIAFHPPGNYDGMDPAEKAAARRKAAKSDILIASDAAACGANLQRATWEINYDLPDTSKTHEQRIGRFDRIGQEEDEVYLHNLTANTTTDKKRRQRLHDKHDLGEVFQSPTQLLDDTGLSHAIRVRRELAIGNAASKMNPAAQEAAAGAADLQEAAS